LWEATQASHKGIVLLVANKNFEWFWRARGTYAITGNFEYMWCDSKQEAIKKAEAFAWALS